MRQRRETDRSRGELGPLVTANILESLRKLTLENIGKSFFCVDVAKFKRYFFQYVERKFRQYSRILHNSRCSSSGFFRLLMITFLYVNPFLRDYQSCLLGSFERVVTKLPVDLFNNRSRCSIKYSANWFPRKCAVILFCCDSDNVAFVLFFHDAHSLSRLANVVLSKNGQSKRKISPEHEPGPCDNFYDCSLLDRTSVRITIEFENEKR